MHASPARGLLTPQVRQQPAPQISLSHQMNRTDYNPMMMVMGRSSASARPPGLSVARQSRALPSNQNIVPTPPAQPPLQDQFVRKTVRQTSRDAMLPSQPPLPIHEPRPVALLGPSISHLYSAPVPKPASFSNTIVIPRQVNMTTSAPLHSITSYASIVANNTSVRTLSEPKPNIIVPQHIPAPPPVPKASKSLKSSNPPKDALTVNPQKPKLKPDEVLHSPISSAMASSNFTNSLRGGPSKPVHKPAPPPTVVTTSRKPPVPTFGSSKAKRKTRAVVENKPVESEVFNLTAVPEALLSPSKRIESSAFSSNVPRLTDHSRPTAPPPKRKKGKKKKKKVAEPPPPPPPPPHVPRAPTPVNLGWDIFRHFGVHLRSKITLYLRTLSAQKAYKIPLSWLDFIDATSTFYDVNDDLKSTKSAWALISRFVLVGSTDSLHLQCASNIIRRYSEFSMSNSFELHVPADLFDEGLEEVFERVKLMFRPEQESAVCTDFQLFNS